MTILITGGGTGGHLAIAKSLRDAAIKAGHRAIFIGSTSGQDRGWFEGDARFEGVHFLQTSGVVNKKGAAKIGALLLSLKATLNALILVRRADCVISVGGFSAAPASFAAVLLRKPFYIHEQNATPGRLNRVLRRFSKAFFSSYEATSLLKDYPVRESFFEGARVRKKVKTVIFLGGSQGARFINELALKIAPLLHDKGIKIIHQAGKTELEDVKEAYRSLGIAAELFDFRPDIDALMEQSDLAVSRSGASTLWELCASGLPALYVPYPHAAADHQFYNAKFLAEKNASWLCRQEDDPYRLLLSLLERDMREQSKVLRELIKPNGAELIIKEVEKCLQK
ncbi:MAG: undecaprenyldiphospho-muramoylpentapeptide beta-N-acetylglucosaminyltransferase [Campylobacterales bacterium]|nr:undecaprenyldiphospho-muramoylpentapeptide beta-N-acetylglucosaminyltransferase [Campylobacterales bacterium]